jgi:Na+/glutamate symporter
MGSATGLTAFGLILACIIGGAIGIWFLVRCIQFIDRGATYFRIQNEKEETFNKKGVLGESDKKVDLADKYIKN